MAHTGMKYPVMARWTREDNTYEAGETYGEGFVAAKAINFTGTPEINEQILYADDEATETELSVKNWGTSLGVDDLPLKVQADILGHEYTAAKEATEEGKTAEPEAMEIGTDDVAPFFGSGFYKRRRKNNITTFTVIWLYKVQHKEPTENAETKGENVNFQTATIEGKAYPVKVTDGNGKTRMAVGKKLLFKTEAEAVAWLKKMANITEA